MKAERGAARRLSDSGAEKKPGQIGSGTGPSRGLAPALQNVTVGVTRGGKKGKTVTVVDGLDVGAAEDAKALVKKFKKILGSGGALAENGSMAFQETTRRCWWTCSGRWGTRGRSKRGR